MKTSLLSGLIFLALLMTAGQAPSVAEEQGIRIHRIFGPEIPGAYKHPTSIEELANGDLYLVYHAGLGEYADGTAVFGSRRAKGSMEWSYPEQVAGHPYLSLGNPVIWQAPDGWVWLLYVTRYGETWATSRIMAKISKDGARTWSDAFMVTFEEGTMVRAHPIALASGEYLFPIYHEAGTDTETVSADCTSLFLLFDPKTRRWSESNRVRSRLGNIQPAVVEVSPGHLLAYCRRGGDYEGRPDGYLVRTESRDGGRTWTAGADSELPNPNAAVDFIRLASGNLLLVFNDSMKDRTPLTAAISQDGGKTFPWRRNLIEGPGSYSYPTAVQAEDGTIYVTFTADERTAIRMAEFKEPAILR